MVWLGFVHWIQGLIYTGHKLKRSGDLGTSTGSSVVSDDRSGELVVLVLLGVIVCTLRNSPCRGVGGWFFFRGRAFFPPSPRRPPPVLVGREGTE
jgi:hypothetical protein